MQAVYIVVCVFVCIYFSTVYFKKTRNTLLYMSCVYICSLYSVWICKVLESVFRSLQGSFVHVCVKYLYLFVCSINLSINT